MKVTIASLIFLFFTSLSFAQTRDPKIDSIFKKLEQENFPSPKTLIINQPLFILNGKEIEYNRFMEIDLNTIESINVIKSKEATDKYGEKGENGVILIELKKEIKPRLNK